MTDATAKKRTIWIIIASLLAAGVCVFIGGQWLSPLILFSDAPPGEMPLDLFSAYRKILLDFRIPRMLAGFVSGAGLAAGGMAYQALFRNPLATPYTLGAASGAALGAALAAVFGATASSAFLSGLSISAAAMIGALASQTFVFWVARSRGLFGGDALLLSGVAVSFILSSLALLAQFLATPDQNWKIVHWLMGNLSAPQYSDVALAAGIVLAGIALIGARGRELDLLLTGEDIALSRGVDVGRLRIELFVSVSVIAGAIVSRFGPIGFVGIIAPHICRMIVGSSHRRLFPATLAFGGAFLVMADTIARSAWSASELPVGVITAIVGGGFFIALLMRKG
ncbi:MAG: iron ABC transporter permease [Planctomycetota bacterium]